MKTLKKYQALIKRTGQIIAFAGAILFATALTLKFGTITSASTVAFCFIIIVLLSAFFGNIIVALTTSVVATLCFDYFYLPPFGTFNIVAFSDWISLAAFLLRISMPLNNNILTNTSHLSGKQQNGFSNRQVVRTS
jgi:K+-sensing histidine kinase KdpD